MIAASDAPGASVMNSISTSPSSPWVATYFVAGGESSEWNSQRKLACLSNSSMLCAFLRQPLPVFSRVRGGSGYRSGYKSGADRECRREPITVRDYAPSLNGRA